MLIGTHALLPVCACLVVDAIRIATDREAYFTKRTLGCVGFFGVLPDLCSPHLSLEARYSSLSHTLLFLGVILPFAALASWWARPGARGVAAVSFGLAAALHLAADAISGGIAWLQPWSPEILGSYCIAPQYWIGFDAGFILLFWFLLRLLPRLEARGIRAAHSIDA